MSYSEKNTNKAIYNMRQHCFAQIKYLKFELNYALLKSSDNYRTLNSNKAQQILKEVGNMCWEKIKKYWKYVR